jgi:hypothetical protein
LAAGLKPPSRTALLADRSAADVDVVDVVGAETSCRTLHNVSPSPRVERGIKGERFLFSTATCSIARGSRRLVDVVVDVVDVLGAETSCRTRHNVLVAPVSKGARPPV